MGKAIAYDLSCYSDFDTITIADKDTHAISSVNNFIKDKRINPVVLDAAKSKRVKEILREQDIAISALPYMFNYMLAKNAIETKTHFLDLGGNNDIVKKEISLDKEARKRNVLVIPDCGLAPGLTSIIARDIVDRMEYIDYVKIRVGGLPLYPKPPLNYQIVFSPLSKGKINREKYKMEYEMIDYYDEKNKITAMMRTTGYSTSIIAQMIEREDIMDKGVLTPEKVVPPDIMFNELKKRGIAVNRKITKVK